MAISLKVDGVELVAKPKEFSVTPIDIDNGESTMRTADGTLNRDRVAVKRQIEMSFGVLKWAEMSSILQAMSGVFFEFYYPDPMDGLYATRTFYVGNRPAPFAVGEGEDIKWNGLKIVLTQQ
jgi:hypothetical protein